MILTQQDLISDELTDLVHAKSNGKFGLTLHSAQVIAEGSLRQNKNDFTYLADLQSQSEFSTQRYSYCAEKMTDCNGVNSAAH